MSKRNLVGSLVFKKIKVFSGGTWKAEWSLHSTFEHWTLHPGPWVYTSVMTNTFLDPKKGFFDPLGSGCGSVGRAVASDTRGPRFKSSHWHILYGTFVYCQPYWKDEIKKKWPGMAHFKKTLFWTQSQHLCIFHYFYLIYMIWYFIIILSNVSFNSVI